MNERPIIFNSEMVRAILDGRKTQTHRVMKPQPEPNPNEPGNHSWPCSSVRSMVDVEGFLINDYDSTIAPSFCPFGSLRDRLWVRETWADVNSAEGPALLYKADDEIRFWQDFCEEFGPDFGAGPSMDYEKYPGDYTMWWTDLLNGAPDHRWKPSIYMPKWASRIKLLIKNIRVERLQDISKEDAIAEGIEPITQVESMRISGWKCYQGGAGYVNPVDAFKSFWESISGADSWGFNPWVWVIEFERI